MRTGLRDIVTLLLNSFAVRVINEWNGLPEAVINSHSVDSFKKRLDAHWETDWYWIPDTD